MAVPTVSGVTPSPIWTGGQLVTITGTNFRPPTIPTYPLAGPYPPVLPTVAVTIGGQPAPTVRVHSPTELEVLAPVHDPGAADVTVQNLDDSGHPISGESATLAGAVTYDRPALTDQPDFTRLVRQVLLELQRQILPEVIQSISVDYAETPFAFTFLSKVPALTLSGPDLTEDRPYYNTDDNIYQGGAPLTRFTKRRVPRTYSLSYTISGFSKSEEQLLALEVAVLQFFDRNSRITILVDPADPSKGTISYTMYMPIDQAVRTTTVPNPSDIKSFTGSFIIRGVNIEELASFPGEGVVETGGTAETITTIPTRI